MPLRAIARLIQTMLYAQRFFPYYVYNILGGIEEDGKFTCPNCLFVVFRTLPMFVAGSTSEPLPLILSRSCKQPVAGPHPQSVVPTS